MFRLRLPLNNFIEKVPTIVLLQLQLELISSSCLAKAICSFHHGVLVMHSVWVSLCVGNYCLWTLAKPSCIIAPQYGLFGVGNITLHGDSVSL